MTEPRPNLAIDPVGDWAVAYSGPVSTTPSPFSSATRSSFVQNPNEIVLFDLKNPPTAVTRTLQSFGGTPQRLVFTPTLALPASKGPRRLLLIETDIDLTMLDLDRALAPSPPPEITVPLTSDTTATQVQTAGLAVDGRNPQDPNDARFAVWASNNTNVFTLQLVAPPTGAANDFVPTIKLTDVGGIPSDVAFVETEDATSPTGLALQVAALVPSKTSAVLVDPDKSLTTTVALPAAYASFSLVTDLVAGTAGATGGTDVALLFAGRGLNAQGVATRLPVPPHPHEIDRSVEEDLDRLRLTRAAIEQRAVRHWSPRTQPPTPILPYPAAGAASLWRLQRHTTSCASSR